MYYIRYEIVFKTIKRIYYKCKMYNMETKLNFYSLLKFTTCYSIHNE